MFENMAGEPIGTKWLMDVSGSIPAAIDYNLISVNKTL
jgi:hypothetical protein